MDLLFFRMSFEGFCRHFTTITLWMLSRRYIDRTFKKAIAYSTNALKGRWNVRKARSTREYKQHILQNPQVSATIFFLYIYDIKFKNQNKTFNREVL